MVLDREEPEAIVADGVEDEEVAGDVLAEHRAGAKTGTKAFDPCGALDGLRAAGEEVGAELGEPLEVRNHGVEEVIEQLLERGRRRKRLEQLFSQLLTEDLEGRVQPFDQAAAVAAGIIAATRQRTGQTVEIRDVQIAARHADP